MKIHFKTIIPTLIVFVSLIAIMALSIFIRSFTLDSPTVLDFDPWWWYRHAKEIQENNFKIPKWDMLSYYPPGRPYQLNQGWPYTIIIFQQILSKFSSGIDLMRAAILSPLLMVALIPIPAFLLGRILSNNIGGLLTALFVVVAPTFISVSMAGYSDSDAPVVFYTLLSIFSIFLSIKLSKRKFLSIPFYVAAVAINLLFVFTWGAGWLPLILFFAFIPSLIVFRLVEEMWHQKRFKFFWKELKPDLKSVFLPLIIIFLITNIVGFVLGLKTMFHSLIGGLAFTGIGGEPLIVNISVAELQTINIFSSSGFFTVANRVGLLPTLLTLLGLPLLVLYKLYKKERISFVEIFLYVWALVTFYLILKGVRFSLLFSVSSAVSSGYVIGNLFNYLRNKNILLFSSVFALIGVMIFVSISNAIQIGLASSLTISQNWYNALDWLKENADKDAMVATWWDPGHIIAGYTGLKVHADGAHCNPTSCIPYNHNIRIRDMGRILSTNDENESIGIIQKYVHLNDTDCNRVREQFGNIVPEDACKDVTEVYVLATNDLIGKYFWISCFGSFDIDLWKSTSGDRWRCDGKNFITMNFVQFDRQGLPVYSTNGITTTLLQNNNQLLAVLNSPGQGIRNALVKDVVYYQNGNEIKSRAENNNTIDGMVWIDPSFRLVIFMDPSVRDSVFTKMFFFDGRDLKNFELVYSNPEVKIFKAKI